MGGIVTRQTILVVGDDAEVATLLHDLLGAAGYRVLAAATSPAAVATLRAFRVRLVIADALPPAQGAERWSALAPLLAAAGAVPVILCSARDPEEYADYADRGCAAFLAKPFDVDALLALVASLLPETRGAGAQGGGHALEQVV